MANSVPFVTREGIGNGCLIDTANTGLDGSGTLGTVVTGDRDGTRVDQILVKAIATTTAGMVRFFFDDGVAKRLIYELAVSAIVPSGTLASFTGSWTPDLPIILKSGQMIKAATHTGEDFQVIPFGGNF